MPTTENLVSNDVNLILGCLKTAGESGIIDLESVWDSIKMNNRKKILEQHKYSIFQGSDGNWRTHLPDPRKKDKRRLIKRKHLLDLEDEIIAYYTGNTLSLMPTLRKLYPEWIQYYSLKTKSSATVYRTVAEWRHYYEGSKIVDTPLKQLRKIDLEKWVLSLIKENNMSKKQYYNASLPLRQMMAYAFEEGYVAENVFARVSVNPKLFRRVKKPESKTQVFLDEETESIVQLALQEWVDDHEIGAALAVAFVFYTGVRIGEVVAFKKSDIIGNYIHVSHAEQRTYQMTEDMRMIFSGRIVSDDAKSEAAYRDVYVTRQGRMILDLALSNAPTGCDDFYLFRNCGERCTAAAVSYRLKKYCRHLDILRRSVNKIRKTYISRMIDSGININALREQVGHEDERTTYNSYCFNRKTSEETNELYEEAFVESLPCSNGLQPMENIYVGNE